MTSGARAQWASQEHGRQALALRGAAGQLRQHPARIAGPRQQAGHGLVQIGLGGWGRDWAREVLPAVPGIEPVAFVDADPAIWRDNQAAFMEASARLAELGAPNEVLDLCRAMSREGLALEQEAVWHVLPGDCRGRPESGLNQPT